jgi:hypothetical protein
MQYRHFGSLYVGTLTNEALLSAPETGPHLSWISETLFQQRKRMLPCAERMKEARKHENTAQNNGRLQERVQNALSKPCNTDPNHQQKKKKFLHFPACRISASRINWGKQPQLKTVSLSLLHQEATLAENKAVVEPLQLRISGVDHDRLPEVCVTEPVWTSVHVLHEDRHSPSQDEHLHP